MTGRLLADADDVVFGATLMWREENAKLAFMLAVYRAALERAGVEPPEDIQTAEFLRVWRAHATVIRAAAEFVHELGTSNELLSDSWLKALDAA